MNKDHIEGSLRSAMGQGEKVVGQAMNDPRTMSSLVTTTPFRRCNGAAPSSWAATIRSGKSLRS